MGQKSNPIANRLGYNRGWESDWYADKDTFTQCLHEDVQIRKCLKKLNRLIAAMVIERTSKSIKLTIHTSKPGVLIGPGGKKVQEIKEAIEKRIGKDIHIDIFEIKNPELNAVLIAKNIAEQIEGRGAYKRLANRVINDTIHAGAKGVKIEISGRLGGVEIARSIRLSKMRVPCQTLRADIGFAKEAAFTTYGTIGIKVWIFTKEVYGKRDLSLNMEVRNKTKSRRQSPLIQK